MLTILQALAPKNAHPFDCKRL